MIIATIELCIHYRGGREERGIMTVFPEHWKSLIKEETLELCFHIQQTVIWGDWEQVFQMTGQQYA